MWCGVPIICVLSLSLSSHSVEFRSNVWHETRWCKAIHSGLDAHQMHGWQWFCVCCAIRQFLFIQHSIYTPLQTNAEWMRQSNGPLGACVLETIIRFAFAYNKNSNVKKHSVSVYARIFWRHQFGQRGCMRGIGEPIFILILPLAATITTTSCFLYESFVHPELNK